MTQLFCSASSCERRRRYRLKYGDPVEQCGFPHPPRRSVCCLPGHPSLRTLWLVKDRCRCIDACRDTVVLERGAGLRSAEEASAKAIQAPATVNERLPLEDGRVQCDTDLGRRSIVHQETGATLLPSRQNIHYTRIAQRIPPWTAHTTTRKKTSRTASSPPTTFYAVSSYYPA